ncbi:hypothetical protein VitviT2T_008302 [Vitis vinifera]|uniref:Uncharacterized protein n=1 Tax=Vitis vinifera TaxID=29760 RepID=A0ABY9C2Y1_VITVI|nr:hypothetical protein VitviT2T_008302 [Vitis vinifera]
MAVKLSRAEKKVQYDQKLCRLLDDGVAGWSAGDRVQDHFESTASFSALPLQPMPKGGEVSGPIDCSLFMSGPLERGTLSGPLDVDANSDDGRVHFLAPLSGLYVKEKRTKGVSATRKALHRNLFEKKRP